MLQKGFTSFLRAKMTDFPSSFHLFVQSLLAMPGHLVPEVVLGHQLGAV